MSFKSIDIQASLPRTAEMSPLAQQHQNKITNEQAMLAQQMIKTSEHDAQRLVRSDPASKGQITDRERRQGGGRQSADSNKKKPGGTGQEEEHRSEHPFKGKHIDFMG